MPSHHYFSMDVGWKALLRDFGIRHDQVLRRAGLPADLLTRQVQVNSADYFRFWRGMEEEAGDPMFALRLVETVAAETFSPPLFAALCSADLMQAVQRLAKYKQLVAPMRLDLSVGKTGDLTVSPHWIEAHLEVPFPLQVAETAFFLRLARLGTREPVQAIRLIYPKMSEPIRETLCQVGGGCWHPGLQVTSDKGLRSVRVRGTTPYPAHGDFETFLCRGQNYHCIL